MKRPDSDVIRRLLKSGALNGKVLSAHYRSGRERQLVARQGSGVAVLLPVLQKDGGV